MGLIWSVPVSSKEDDRAWTNGGEGKTYHRGGGIQNRFSNWAHKNPVVSLVCIELSWCVHHHVMCIRIPIRPPTSADFPFDSGWEK